MALEMVLETVLETVLEMVLETVLETVLGMVLETVLETVLEMALEMVLEMVLGIEVETTSGEGSSMTEAGGRMISDREGETERLVHLAEMIELPLDKTTEQGVLQMTGAVVQALVARDLKDPDPLLHWALVLLHLPPLLLIEPIRANPMSTKVSFKISIYSDIYIF